MRADRSQQRCVTPIAACAFFPPDRWREDLAHRFEIRHILRQSVQPDDGAPLLRHVDGPRVLPEVREGAVVGVAQWRAVEIGGGACRGGGGGGRARRGGGGG